MSYCIITMAIAYYLRAFVSKFVLDLKSQILNSLFCAFMVLVVVVMCLVVAVVLFVVAWVVFGACFTNG